MPSPRFPRRALPTGAPNRSGAPAPAATALAAAVLGALLLGASGCSGAAAVPVAADPAAAVSDAVAAAAKVHSAQVETSTTMALNGNTQVFTGSGAFNFDTQVGYISLTEPKAGYPLEEIITPTMLYLRDGYQTGASPETSAQSAKWHWVSALNLPDGDVISAGCTTPLFDFALLHGVSAGTVRYVGQTTVSGAPVAEYSGTLDLTAAAGESPQPYKQELQAAAHSFSKQTVAFDAYIDAQGELRRVTAHFVFPAQAPAHGDVQITAMTDLFALNSKVTVSAPPSADLAPQAALGPAASAQPTAKQ